jgi:Protein of unknown function (DUF2961)
MLRRGVVKSLARAAGLVGLGGGGMRRVVGVGEAGAGMGKDDLVGTCLPAYTQMQRYRTLKVTSFDRTGGNEDWWTVDPGVEREIFAAHGPGAISHLWFTGVPFKDAVLRAYWDGNSRPSIEVPIGDFFGLNLGEFAMYHSTFLACSPGSSLNSYFTMPYRTGARLTVTNEGSTRIEHLYFQVDAVELDRVPDETLYFHAQYRQATPTVAQHLPGEKNLDGAQNYVFCETHGRGHLMGVTLGVVSAAPGWMGEGDDMTFIDDPSRPATNGTGLEDYFNGSWGFTRSFAFEACGVPFLKEGQSCSYRFHTDSPIAFTRYLKHTIEHGAANDRADYYYSVAYWYQDKPAMDFPALPSLADRMVGLSAAK